METEFNTMRVSRSGEGYFCADSQVADGAEVDVEVLDPPINGRIDWLSGGEVRDFKTGQRDEKHAAQLRFYALLLWLKTGRIPDALTLIYTEPFERVPVPMPTGPELAIMRQDIQAAIHSISRAIAEGSIPACPAEDVCQWCPVKAHCDMYWTSPSTRALRLRELAQPLDGVEGTWFQADLEISSIPEPDAHGFIAGEAYCPGLGPVHVALGQTWKGTVVKPAKARVLGARIYRSPDGWEVSLGSGTEVFWGDKGPPARRDGLL
jgi:hypothetical protein